MARTGVKTSSGCASKKDANLRGLRSAGRRRNRQSSWNLAKEFLMAMPVTIKAKSHPIFRHAGLSNFRSEENGGIAMKKTIALAVSFNLLTSMAAIDTAGASVIKPAAVAAAPTPLPRCIGAATARLAGAADGVRATGGAKAMDGFRSRRLAPPPGNRSLLLSWPPLLRRTRLLLRSRPLLWPRRLCSAPLRWPLWRTSAAARLLRAAEITAAAMRAAMPHGRLRRCEGGDKAPPANLLFTLTLRIFFPPTRDNLLLFPS